MVFFGNGIFLTCAVGQTEYGKKIKYRKDPGTVEFFSVYVERNSTVLIFCTGKEKKSVLCLPPFFSFFLMLK